MTPWAEFFDGPRGIVVRSHWWFSRRCASCQLKRQRSGASPRDWRAGRPRHASRGFPICARSGRQPGELRETAGVADGPQAALDGGSLGAPDLVEDVARFVRPAQLDGHVRVDQGQGRAQAGATVAADQLQPLSAEAPAVQIVEEGLPGLVLSPWAWRKSMISLRPSWRMPSATRTGRRTAPAPVFLVRTTPSNTRTR